LVEVEVEKQPVDGIGADKMECCGKKAMLASYEQLVTSTVSETSAFNGSLVERINKADFPIAKLLTGAIGLTAEAGEFAEIVKKITFQGKPYDEASRTHMLRELGDVLWYLTLAAQGLDSSLDEIINMNFDKLSTRFPEGYFTEARSENRAKGDI